MIRNYCNLIKLRRIIFFTLVATLSLSININAQVTIGSDQRPNSGALLDLKQESDGSSFKGLGLPRVILKSYGIPKDETSLSSTIKDATGEWDREEHIGLMVYNVSEYDICDSYTMRPGPYVWDGDKWQYLNKIERVPEVGEYVDPRDGERYLYRRFGDAGEWMLENLRYIHPDFIRSYIVNDPLEKVYAYPNPNPGSVGGDAVPETWRPEQGLLYTYAAITLGVQDDVEINQGVTEEAEYEEGPNPPIQEICPPGWHIPSDKEWTELEREVYKQANLYSRYTRGEDFPFEPVEWQEEWDKTFNDVRGAESEGGHGIAMLSECPPVGSSISTTGGKSLPSSLGGLNILLVGSTDETGILSAYGRAAGYWTSSVFGLEYAWFRLFDIQFGAQAQVPRGVFGRESLTALRCKR